MEGQDNRKSSWVRLIETIDSPLGFYVLALLIVEACLTLILTKSNIPKEELFSGLVVGSCLFCLVVIIVAILVYFKPENLTFDKTSHLKRHEDSFGTGKGKLKEISNIEEKGPPPIDKKVIDK